MDIAELPRLKKALLDKRFTIAVEEPLKKKLMELRYQHGIDVGEWIRNMIKSEMPKMFEKKQS